MLSQSLPFSRLLVLPVLFLALGGCAVETVAPRPEGPISVVLISPDSLRADRLSPWSDDAPATPHFDALAASGTVFTNAWAASPWTAPSMVSVMTGLYPPSHGVVYRDDTTPAALPTLPRLLAARDYHLGNFSFFSEISYFRNLGLGPPPENLHHQSVAESFARWLAEVPSGESFFAWVHLLETHLPYGATGYRASEAEISGSTGLEAAQTRGVVEVGTVEFEYEERDTVRRLYDRDVVAMDEALGEVIAALEAAGRRGTTLVIFVADHGEELFEDGWIGHASTAAEAKLIPAILRVPLVLAGPGVPAGQVEDALVQQVDVLPSVAEILGLEEGFDGENLDGELLPGLFETWSGPVEGEREYVFFDSAPGGNLTPQERRGERVQGASDGSCVIEVWNYPERSGELRVHEAVGGGCYGGHPQELRPVLDEWRNAQARRRLEVLERYGAGTAPAPEEVASFEESLEIRGVASGTTLDWLETGGQIALEWSGEGEEYWIEYEIGPGGAVKGSFQVTQRRVVFGPVPEGYWNELAAFNPFRVRLVDAVHEQRSKWVEIELKETI